MKKNKEPFILQSTSHVGNSKSSSRIPKKDIKRNSPQKIKKVKERKAINAKITKMLSKNGISNTKILSTLKKDKKITLFYNKNKNVRKWGKDAQRACFKDIERLRLTIKAERIKPVLPVEQITIPEDYDISKYNSVRNIFLNSPHGFDTRSAENKFKFDTTLALFDKTITDKNRTSCILSLQCGSSKSYSSLLAIAERATKKRRIWFVSNSIDECKRSAAILKSLGTNVVAFHGRVPDACLEKDNKKFWRNKKDYCEQCKDKCGAQLKYCLTERYDFTQADVVCCTHKNFLNALEANEKPQIDLAIIDEAPNVFETFSFTEHDIDFVYRFLNRNSLLQEILDEDVNKITRTLSDKGGHLIEKPLITKYYNKIRNFVFEQYEDDRITEEEKDFVMRFLYFFQKEKIYGFKTRCKNTIKKGRKYISNYRFMARTMNLDIGCQVIILDGSARNQPVKWDGFKIYECNQLKFNYPKTTITCFCHNPTQSILKDSKVFKKLSDEAQKNIKKDDEVLLFMNKNIKNKPSIFKNYESLKKKIIAIGANVTELVRSQNVGTNKGRKCNHTVISMSLFTDVADYVLRACVFNDCEIPFHEIWKGYDVETAAEKKSLRIKSNNSWQNPLIQDQYIRSLERDLYQTIMRGRIRDDSDAEYYVTALISNENVLATLAEDLPEANFRLPDSKTIEFLLQGYKESEIKQQLEVLNQTKVSQQTIHNQVKAYRKL